MIFLSTVCTVIFSVPKVIKDHKKLRLDRPGLSSIRGTYPKDSCSLSDHVWHNCHNCGRFAFWRGKTPHISTKSTYCIWLYCNLLPSHYVGTISYFYWPNLLFALQYNMISICCLLYDTGDGTVTVTVTVAVTVAVCYWCCCCCCCCCCCFASRDISVFHQNRRVWPPDDLLGTVRCKRRLVSVADDLRGRHLFHSHGKPLEMRQYSSVAIDATKIGGILRLAARRSSWDGSLQAASCQRRGWFAWTPLPAGDDDTSVVGDRRHDRDEMHSWFGLTTTVAVAMSRKAARMSTSICDRRSCVSNSIFVMSEYLTSVNFFSRRGTRARVLVFHQAGIVPRLIVVESIAVKGPGESVCTATGF